MNLISMAMGIADMLGIPDKIATLLGGNNGDKVAQKIIEITQAVTGEKNISNCAKRLNEDPLMLAKVQDAILKQEVELNKLAFGDKQNAREMQGKALEQEDRFSKRFIYYFAFYWAVVSTAYMFGVTFVTLSPLATRFADTILGFLLATIVGGIISFFYGASLKQDKGR